jgi:hypothetical protein
MKLDELLKILSGQTVDKDILVNSQQLLSVEIADKYINFRPKEKQRAYDDWSPK